MAAAARSPLRDLYEEVTCPICLECFKEPVTITICGHNFCRACLSCYGQGPEISGTSCPHCRKTFDHRQNIIPNRLLANVVEIAEKFRRAEESPAEANLCEKYHRPVKVICGQQTVLHCAICGPTKPTKSNHGSPTMQKTNDTTTEHTDRNTLVEMLKEGKQNVLAQQSDKKKKSKDLLRQIKAERAEATSLFKDLHHFLEEQEKQFLAQMVEVEEEITRKRDSFMSFFSQELSLYETIIQKIQTSQQPNNALFKEILKSFQSEEKITDRPSFQPALKWRIWDFCDINHTLKEITKRFKDTWLSGLQLQKANITLDPDTAHPQLTLFLDGKTVELGERCQELPNNPARFDFLSVVLGREEFKGGRHFWEVNVESQKEWAVGISLKSVKRKDSFSLNTAEGISMLGRWRGDYRFSLPPNPLPHIPDKKFKKIRVCLNCAVGKISFFDAETGILLYSTTSFPGEVVLPFFWLGSYAQLSLCQ
ncbi:PREDICTED: tripartite motif-containing protein 7-like [Thamnophis sirtalis]|uniref:Tripartite motif-containing protein 7-like n=1 Tax=Thamnophis sirtalis TaxID=35019 RepID=A0A6I9YUV8_9SAUR|nr:PREDICTED: tripartite motif-containing protein 7-like [Thamnophis sirtalis]